MLKLTKETSLNHVHFGELISIKTVYNTEVIIAKKELLNDGKSRLAMFNKKGDLMQSKNGDREVIHRGNLIVTGEEEKSVGAQVEDALLALGGYVIKKAFPKTQAAHTKLLASGYECFRFNEDGVLVHDPLLGLVFAKKSV